MSFGLTQRNRGISPIPGCAVTAYGTRLSYVLLVYVWKSGFQGRALNSHFLGIGCAVCNMQINQRGQLHLF